MFGSNLGPTHIHAVARRDQFLQEAEHRRKVRMAGAPPSMVRALRQAAGRSIVAIGLRLHGDLPHPQPGCRICDVGMAS